MEIKKGQEVWLSKYALSAGITKEISESSDEKWIRLKGRNWFLFVAAEEVHATKEAAVAAAEAMRKKKLASLRKQIAKLEAMKF